MQDCLFNSNTGKGWLEAGLKNQRQLVKKTKNNRRSLTPDIDFNNYTEVEAQRDVGVLKSTVVNDKNMHDIKQLLKVTKDYRWKLVNDVNLSFIDVFPYFFVCPELVSTDKNVNQFT